MKSGAPIVKLSKNSFSLYVDSAEEWHNLGLEYYWGLQNKVKDLLKAKICFDQALKMNPNDASSLHFLGMIYEYGNGVKKNIAKALEYYARGKQEKDYLSTRCFIRLTHPKVITADQWYDLGQEYYYGLNGQDIDYLSALVCYNKTIELNPQHINANYSLGLIYNCDKEVTVNYRAARKHYTQVRNYLAARKKLKLVEKNVALRMYQQEGHLEQRDEKNQTPLHRAANNKFLKHCARLMLLGAKPQLDHPLQNLNKAQKIQVTLLQAQLSQLINHLKEHPAEIIATRFFIKGFHHKDETTLQLKKLYENPNISPLLDLARLATLGLHDLSKRSKFTKNGYDSDEDCNEKINQDIQCLSIHVDSKSSHVGGIAYYGEDGLQGESAFGTYLLTNTIFIGGQRDPVEAFWGTFIHELTHFIVEEVYKNYSNPYTLQNKENEAKFIAITNDLASREKELDPLLQAAFSQHYAQCKKVHNELIVRVPHIIVRYSDGLDRLKKQAPDLLGYYMNFLEDVENHTRKLHDRALSYWPLDVLIKEEQPLNQNHRTLRP